MLVMMCVKVPVDGDVISIYHPTLLDLGTHPFQNLWQETNAKKYIKQ